MKAVALVVCVAVVLTGCSAQSETGCGTRRVNGSELTTFCGDGSARLVLDDRTYIFAKASCTLGAQTVSLNAGTVAKSSKAQGAHDYLTVQVGVADRFPASKDGTYEAVAVSFGVDKVSYALVGSPDGSSRPQVTLSNSRRRAIFRGTALETGGAGSASVTGSFVCPASDSG